MVFLQVSLVAYLIGSLTPGAWISKYLYGINILEKGSGVSGATNVLRNTDSKSLFLAVVILDTLKGMLPVYYLQHMGYPMPVILTGAAAVIVGHTKSIFLKFKGGKAICTGLGVLLVLAPWYAAIALPVFALGYLAGGQRISVGSLLATMAVLITALAMACVHPDNDLSKNIFVTALCLGVVALHHKNIAKLRRGEELPTRLFGKRASI